MSARRQDRTVNTSARTSDDGPAACRARPSTHSSACCSSSSACRERRHGPCRDRRRQRWQRRGPVPRGNGDRCVGARGRDSDVHRARDLGEGHALAAVVAEELDGALVVVHNDTNDVLSAELVAVVEAARRVVALAARAGNEAPAAARANPLLRALAVQRRRHNAQDEPPCKRAHHNR